jgi:hypothetical protein
MFWHLVVGLLLFNSSKRDTTTSRETGRQRTVSAVLPNQPKSIKRMIAAQ